MLPIVTDLEPYSLRIQSAFGRLMPMAVGGYWSPARTVTFITLAETPFTSFLRKRGSTGELSSNHWAFALMVEVRSEAAWSLKSAIASHEALRFRGSS